MRLITTKYEQQRAFVIKMIYWGIVILLTALCFKYIFPVLIPLFIAALIALLLNHPINKIHQKIPINRKIICVVSVVVFFSIIGTIISILGFQIVNWLKEFVSSIPSIFNDVLMPVMEEGARQLDKWFGLINPEFGNNLEVILQAFSEAVIYLSAALLSYLTSIAAKVPSLFAKTIITIVVTVFITIDFEQIKNFVLRQIPESKTTVASEAHNFFGGTLLKCIGSYVVILGITFLELSIGLSLLHINNALWLALLIAFVDILPVLGTGSVLIPWGIIELIAENYITGFGLLVLYIVITIIRNTIEPKLVGKQMGLHPVLTFAGMLLGLKHMGFFGMLGVPLIFAFIKMLNDKKIIHVFR